MGSKIAEALAKSTTANVKPKKWDKDGDRDPHSVSNDGNDPDDKGDPDAGHNDDEDDPTGVHPTHDEMATSKELQAAMRGDDHGTLSIALKNAIKAHS